MNRKLRKLASYPSTADGLLSQLCFIWDNLPNNYFFKLMESMKSRYTDIPNIKGGTIE